MQASIMSCLSKSGYVGMDRQKGHSAYKWGDDRDGGTDSSYGAASKRIVSASDAVIFPCTIK